MEYKIRLQYKKISPVAIRNVVLQLEVSILKDNKTGNKYITPLNATQDAKRINQILGKKWNDTLYKIK